MRDPFVIAFDCDDHWAAAIARGFFGDHDFDQLVEVTTDPDLPVILFPIEHDGAELGMLPKIDFGLNAPRRLTSESVTVNVLTAGVSALVMVDPLPDIAPSTAGTHPLLN